MTSHVKETITNPINNIKYINLLFPWIQRVNKANKNHKKQINPKIPVDVKVNK